MKETVIKRKIYFTIGVFSLFFIITFLQLANIQIFKYDDYVLAANAQYVKNLEDNFNRGKIFFTKNNANDVLVAGVRDDKKIKNEKEYIIRNRFYPLSEIGAKVLGFVAYAENSRVGRYGIEKYYDDVLGRDSDKLYTNFFAEIFGDIKGELTSDKPYYEGDITLTIDVEAQKYLYDILKDTKEKWSSDKIGGIIMDPRDGRIIAMEELPTYDPNKFGDVNDASLFKNDLISGVYEVGSIIKPITMAAALDSGSIDTDTFYNDVGSRELNGRTVSNFDKGARGWVNVSLILDKSLNMGIVFLVEKMGIESFQDYFRKFGLNTETGIDLPNELSGLTKNLNSKVFVDSATAGFGQGIAITPIQTVRALAALGNGGKLVNPYVVRKVDYKNGISKDIQADTGEQIISAKTSEEVSRMLVHVVDTALANGDYKMDKYSIAAKTGTAQIPIPNGGYYKDRYLHSFFGYFPAYNPEYIIFLYHVNPKNVEYASKTLTDPFFKIVDFLISYYGVAPDRDLTLKK